MATFVEKINRKEPSHHYVSVFVLEGSEPVFKSETTEKPLIRLEIENDDSRHRFWRIKNVPVDLEAQKNDNWFSNNQIAYQQLYISGESAEATLNLSKLGSDNFCIVIQNTCSSTLYIKNVVNKEISVDTTLDASEMAEFKPYQAIFIKDLSLKTTQNIGFLIRATHKLYCENETKIALWVNQIKSHNKTGIRGI